MFLRVDVPAVNIVFIDFLWPGVWGGRKVGVARKSRQPIPGRHGDKPNKRWSPVDWTKGLYDPTGGMVSTTYLKHWSALIFAS